MIRSWRWTSSLLFAAAGAVGCAVGAPPDAYSGSGGDDGVNVEVEAGVQPEASSEAAPADGSSGGRASDATAKDTGPGVDASQPDVVAGGDASSPADAGQETSMPEASPDVTEDDSSDDADTDGGGAPEAGSGNDSGPVCNRHNCSDGCCDTSGVCHTKPSPDNCPTSFQGGAACEDCKAEGEDYCVLDLIVYICSSTP